MEINSTSQSTENCDNGSFVIAVLQVRKRARMLRLQAIGAIITLIISAFAISAIFVSLHRLGDQNEINTYTIRAPYDYRLMETKHEAIAARLKEIADLMTGAKQELITDKYGRAGVNQELVVRLLQARLDDVEFLRNDLERRISEDRDNIYREVLQLTAERDRAREVSAEKRSFIRLVGEAVMRVGVLILAIYLIAIVSSIAKYWLRVADHLTSIADSLDLFRAAGLSVGPAIAALTPHPIDFQAEDVGSIKSIDNLVSAVAAKVSNVTPKSGV